MASRRLAGEAEIGVIFVIDDLELRLGARPSVEGERAKVLHVVAVDDVFQLARFVEAVFHFEHQLVFVEGIAVVVEGNVKDAAAVVGDIVVSADELAVFVFL